MNKSLVTILYPSFISVVMIISGCDETGITNAVIDNSETIVKDGTIVETATLVNLGEKLYNDTNLSSPAGQSCASCHSHAVGFDDPDNGDATSLGADGFSIGNRNSPTASYAAHIPDTQIILREPPSGGPARPVLMGGQFLDGRAESLEEQAKGPFLNPAEMANGSKADVVSTIKLSAYADDFEILFGADVLDDVDKTYDYIADAIAAFERTTIFSPFTSKFDQVQNASAIYTRAEARGETLFNGKAQCARCHSTPDGDAQVFSDFEYRNVGVPANPDLIISLGEFTDNGLGDVTGSARDNGKFRTPNLRNIAITAPYMHNGIFTTLTEVVNFYNTRDSGFPVVVEVNENIDNGGNIGELNLTAGEAADLVAFLETLTD